MVTDGQESDTSEDKPSLFPSHDQEKSLVEQRQQLREASAQRNDSATTIFSHQYLFLAALTCRPPPLPPLQALHFFNSQQARQVNLCLV